MHHFFTSQWLQLLCTAMLAVACCLPCTFGLRANVTVLVLYSGSGDFAFVSDTVTITPYWQQHLQERLLNDPTWPFNATVQMVDVQSNFTLAAQLTTSYLTSPTPSTGPIVAVIAAETVLGEVTAAITADFGVATLLAADASDTQYTPDHQRAFTTSFFVLPPPVYQYRSLVDAYVSLGATTLVAVAYTEGKEVYNEQSCFGMADYAASVGIQTLTKVLINPANTTADVHRIVQQLRDVYRPHLVVWCHWESCALREDVPVYNPMPVFQAESYLPQALVLLDCVDQPAISELYAQGLMQYVSAPQYVNNKLQGPDDNEDDYPYSNIFRPNNTVTSIVDDLNDGQTATSYSSTQLFYKWYASLTGGSTASYQTLATQAAFDLVEAALYRAATFPSSMADGVLSPAEVLATLEGAALTTPFGRVSFDAHGVNSGLDSYVVQVLPSSATAEVVYPATPDTLQLVYPIPTWASRVYVWALMNSGYEKAVVGIAAMVTVIMSAIVLTAIYHREAPEIRMLHYGHISSCCFAAIVICWGLALTWQADVLQVQCSAYLWLTYLPASYIVNINNMKAYRLSVFFRNNGILRKPFPHSKVLKLALAGTAITVITLIIAATADAPVATLTVVDVHRPALDYYQCTTGSTTQGLLIFLVVAHGIAAAVCVTSVRNGMEAFRDGSYLRDAFILIYALVIMVFILSQLSLGPDVMYVLRSVFLQLGICAFNLRLLLGRCVKLWLTEKQYGRWSKWQLRIASFIESIVPTSTRVSSMHSHRPSLAGSVDGVKSMRQRAASDFSHMLDSPLYQMETPQDDALAAMIAVINDPVRGKVFERVAAESLCLELLSFVREVEAYKLTAQAMLIQSSRDASLNLLNRALTLYRSYIKVNAADEINISSTFRQAIEKQLDDWRLVQGETSNLAKQVTVDTVPLLTPALASLALQQDSMRRSALFEASYREICIVLRQNLWSKYCLAETQHSILMSG